MRDMMREYPDREGFERCDRCGARLEGSRWHYQDPTWDAPLHCPVCDLDERAEREEEAEGRW